MSKPDEKIDDEGRELAAAMDVAVPGPEVEPGEEEPSKETAPKTPGIEDEFRKFREEWESSRKDLETKISQLQNENQFYRMRLDERGGREVSREEVEKEEPFPISDEEYYKNPVKASVAITEYVLKKQVAQAQKEQEKRYETEMKSAYQAGRDRTFKKYPDLFKGIEPEVEGIVYQAFKEKKILNPRQMEDENMWTFAGEMVRRTKGELNFEKYYKPNPEAQDAGFQETPSAGRVRGKNAPSVEFDEEAETFLEEMNRGEKKPITKEEVYSMMSKPPQSKRKSK